MRAKRPYHVRWTLKRGMTRPATWRCLVEITDYVETLIWRLLGLESHGNADGAGHYHASVASSPEIDTSVPCPEQIRVPVVPS